MAPLRRIAPDETLRVMALLAGAGSTPRTPESWSHDRMTALVLGSPDAPQAVMPMALRTIRSAPTAPALTVGWLSANQFAARMSLRRATRETFGEWPALLPEVDALFVVRRDERSLPARWYGHTGFHDVLAIRCMYLDDAAHAAASIPAEAAGPYHVQTVTPGAANWDAGRWQSHMLAVYRDVFGAMGGAPERSADFWRPTLAHHFYSAHYQFQILGLWTAPASDPAAALMGYAVVGWSGWHSKRPRMDILELATRQWDAPAATALIRATAQLASSKNVSQIRAVISAHDPYRGHLARSGFIDRWGYLLAAKWLHPQRHLDRLAAQQGELDSVAFSAPGLPPLHLPGHAAPDATAVSVLTDAATLTRLLLNRLDLADAAHTQSLVTATGRLSEPKQRRLAMAFPWTPWIFHMLDYI